MSDDKEKSEHKSPEQAHREGLEQLDHPALHQTTAKTHQKVYEERLDMPHEPEMEHGGHLPGQKR